MKTEDFESARDVQIAVIAPGHVALNYHTPHVEKTQDWKRIDVTFNSLEFSQVNLYLGVWGGGGARSGGTTCGSSRPGWSTWSAARERRCAWPATTAARLRRGAGFPERGRSQAGHDALCGRIHGLARAARPTLPAGSRIRPGEKVL